MTCGVRLVGSGLRFGAGAEGNGDVRTSGGSALLLGQIRRMAEHIFPSLTFTALSGSPSRV